MLHIASCVVEQDLVIADMNSNRRQRPEITVQRRQGWNFRIKRTDVRSHEISSLRAREVWVRFCPAGPCITSQREICYGGKSYCSNRSCCPPFLLETRKQKQSKVPAG